MGNRKITGGGEGRPGVGSSFAKARGYRKPERNLPIGSGREKVRPRRNKKWQYLSISGKPE